MTTHARRRLMLALVLIALAFPIESVLVPAVNASDPNRVADDWARSLSKASLGSALDTLAAYPVAYRRAMIRAVTPAQRSGLLRAHINDYIVNRPALSGEVLAVLAEASALASPENLMARRRDTGARAKEIGLRLTALVGRADAVNLLAELGPADGTFKSSEPVRLKFATWLHDRVTAIAAEFMSCDCHIDFGCGRGECQAGTGCTVDDSWPACGWLWMQDCDGKCSDTPSGS